jgi:type IV pilus assembly protein PilA
MKKQDGFRSTELMNVVAIVSIFAAVAVPAYGNYIKRVKVVEGLTLLGALKKPAESWFSKNHVFPSVASLGVKTGGVYVTKIGLAIRFAYSASFIDTDITGALTLSYDTSNKTWDCAANTTIPRKYLPSDCK